MEQVQTIVEPLSARPWFGQSSWCGLEGSLRHRMIGVRRGPDALNSLQSLHQWRWLRIVAIGAGTSFRPMKLLCLSTHILAELVRGAKITRRQTCQLPAGVVNHPGQ